MFDTMVTIVGNALNTPEWRRVDGGRVLVSNFKVASTSRKYDRAHDRWVDGASLRVRVNCWRRLAENVSSCVLAGDPVIVTGRLYSREWEGEDKVRRVSYELDAVAVGHDLSKGRGKFARQRASMSTTTVEDEESEARVGGERAPLVPELNDRPLERRWDDELGGYVSTRVPDELGSGFSAPEYASLSGGRLRTGRTDEIDFATFAGTGAVGERRDDDGDPEVDDIEALDGLADDLEAAVAAGADGPSGGEAGVAGEVSGDGHTGGHEAGDEGADGDGSDGDGSYGSDGSDGSDGDGDTLASRRRKRGRVAVPA